ncbi:MAG TPA: acetate--CoA ligase family protein, partial [Firmicutes bacterium]|nr:acetate--CoA ligase family protein [Bacillota bacterium]
WSLSAGIGFSQFVSMGNKSDLDEADFIMAAAEDPNTSVILCYLEDVTNGERFLDVVRKASQIKPVIILKSGTSQDGARAASSHTGALAGSDLAYDTAFKQSGVIRAMNMSDLFDLAVAFVNQPVPAGNRVALVTNSGGPGIIATDSVERNSLKMARFNKETKEYMRSQLPVEASVYNPVDILGDATPERYKIALESILKDDNTDSALVLLSPTAVTEPVAIANIVVELHKKYPHKPLFTSYMGGDSLTEGIRILSEAGIPCYTFPEPALKAISGLVTYDALRTKLHKNKPLAPATDVDKEKVKAVFAEVLRDNRLTLLGSEATQVAEAYKIPVAPVYLVKSPDEAVAAADKMGYPVVLKIASPQIIHKSDVGGVKIGLESAQEVRDAYNAIMESVTRALPDTPIYGIEVQSMMPKGNETLIGMTRDAQFGPLIAFGMGGIYVNLLQDVSFRLANGLTQEDIEEMISETKAYTLLKGYRGSEPSHIPSIIDTIARIAQLSLDFPEIAELDLNPVIAYPDKAAALDVKITLAGDDKQE